MALNVPDVGSQIVDRAGRPSPQLNAFFNLLERALLLAGPFSPGDIIIFAGGNNGESGGAVTGFVKKVGDLTDHAVILGSGTNFIHALGSFGTAGQVLTSGGAAADPSWADNATTDFVVMSNGATPPSPLDDGNGNFIYVPYTP